MTHMTKNIKSLMSDDTHDKKEKKKVWGLMTHTTKKHKKQPDTVLCHFFFPFVFKKWKCSVCNSIRWSDQGIWGRNAMFSMVTVWPLRQWGFHFFTSCYILSYYTSHWSVILSSSNQNSWPPHLNVYINKAAVKLKVKNLVSDMLNI